MHNSFWKMFIQKFLWEKIKNACRQIKRLKFVCCPLNGLKIKKEREFDLWKHRKSFQ